MNLNDILAQQQANMNAAVQASQRYLFGIAAVELALFLLSCLVIYLFYARLRDIADELRKFRIAYESAEDATARVRSRAAMNPANPIAPPAERTDAKYMPRK